MLKEAFIELISKYKDDPQLSLTLWDELEKNYSHTSRHYHTLQHLENLLKQLVEVKSEIRNWDAVLFTLFYHDAIYNVIKKDNEERSAALAEKRMKQIAVPDLVIQNCKSHILATKNHLTSDDSDTNYFTDADLSVLGQNWDVYSEYYKNVREEYSVYPNLLYNPGRKQVLLHFLGMNRIFKTNYFYNHFEQRAKQNLQKELKLL